MLKFLFTNQQHQLILLMLISCGLYVNVQVKIRLGCTFQMDQKMPLWLFSYDKSLYVGLKCYSVTSLFPRSCRIITNSTREIRNRLQRQAASSVFRLI